MATMTITTTHVLTNEGTKTVKYLKRFKKTSFRTMVLHIAYLLIVPSTDNNSVEVCPFPTTTKKCDNFNFFFLSCFFSEKYGLCMNKKKRLECNFSI